MDPALVIALFSFILAVAVFVLVLTVNRHGTGKKKKKRQTYDLTRHTANPVISPLAHRDWEAEGTFNPGAVEDDDGKVHLFYRAIGRDGISRVGHVSSEDGRRFTNRSPYPVYEPLPGYGMPEASEANVPHAHDLNKHPSGGGWGGGEDPRMVRIGERVYMTYTAFEGWDNMRIAVTSIALTDMKAEHWKWKQPIVISPKGAKAKNWVLFPEKIHGKYALLHGIAPKIMIAYIDSPDAVPPIESLPDHGGGGYGNPTRKGMWDERVRGAGAPPLKTDIGWLLLYHGLDSRDHKHMVGYKVGAMILDLDDPTKVLYRSPEPILSPDMSYENDGKPGVVYASGAVIKGDKLMVYYGGGDRHTCVAETPLKSLLEWLTAYGKV